MPSIRQEVNLLEGLERCLTAAGPHLLFVPPEVTNTSQLVELALREQRGYREVELDVVRRKLAQLTSERAHALATCPWERDILTGERTPIAPDLWRVERDIVALETQATKHEQVLASLDTSTMKDSVVELLKQFEIHPRSEWQEWQRRSGEAMLIDIVTYGYGLVDDPERRLEARRYYYSLPEEQDWE